MSWRRSRYVAPLLLSAALCAVDAPAASQPSDADVAASILRNVLDTNSSEAVAEDRQACVSGAQAEATKFTRANGLAGFPDTADYCVMVLIRTGRDGRLLDAYREVVARGKGDEASIPTLPAAIGGALLKQKVDTVSIGHGLVVSIRPALAFDAGFSAAYLAGDRDLSGLPTVTALKAVAERCLDEQEGDLGQCFWSGYAFAARALNGKFATLEAFSERR